MNFYNFFLNDFIYIFSEIYIFIFINILLIYGVIYNTSLYYNFINLVKNISWLTILILIITLSITLNNNLSSCIIFNGTLIHTKFTLFFKIFILIFSILTIFISFNYLKNAKINTFEYNILLLFVILGGLFVISSNDFLSLYLSIEILSIALYILASYKKNSTLSTEAGLKYIILGSFSSGLYLFGVSLIYGFTGTINFTNLNILFFDDLNLYYGIILGLIFLLISFLFKLGVAPYHMWVPDIYEGIPTSITIFLTTVPKIALLSILIRICYTCFYNLIVYWQILLLITAIISIILGTFILILQKKIKRFLAYSSIVHLGYILLGLSVGTLEGVQASLLYLIIYMINTINIWSLLISLEAFNNKIKYITDLNFLYKKNPLLAFIFTISLFSLAGIPPLAGFFAKFYIFFSLLENNFYIIVIIIGLTSVISSFYYIRIIKLIYFESKQTNIYYKQISYNNCFVLIFSTFLIIFFIFFLKNFITLTTLISLQLIY